MIWLKWACVFCLPLCPQDADRNFTGTWTLNTASSQIGALPVPPDPVLRIRHTGFSIECAPEELIERGCAYRTDGTEARVEGKGVTISSRTKWEGSSLLANSIVSGPKNYTRMDRWTLSRDGNTLRVRRQIVSRYGETESLLFYERQSPATHSEAGAVSPRVETGTPSDAMRFGRHVLKPVDPAAYQYTTLDGIAIPSVRNPQVSVSCLAYEEEARIYVEVVLRNDSVRSIDIGDNFIFIESEGRLIPRIDAALVSEKVHAGAVRRFQPTATGKHPRRGEPVYDRAAVDAQVKRPLQWREQESAFAGLLAALAHTGPMTVGPGQESTILATFEQRRDRKSPVIVKIQVGADASRFELKSTL